MIIIRFTITVGIRDETVGLGGQSHSYQDEPQGMQVLNRRLKCSQLLSLGCLLLAALCISSSLLASERPVRFVIQSQDRDETYCLLTMPDGWRLERLSNRQNSRDSFLFTPLFGDLPSISIDVFASSTLRSTLEDSDEKEGQTVELLSQPNSIGGRIYDDQDRELSWSRQADDRLVTISVELERQDYFFLFRFLERKSQRPTLEPTIIKIIDSLDFAPKVEVVEEVLLASQNKEKNLKKVINERKWSNENQPEFDMTLASEERTGWVIWISVFVTVAAVLVALVFAERTLRRRQEESFAKEVTDYMDERRTPKGYDHVSPHFKAESEESSTTLSVEDVPEED